MSKVTVEKLGDDDKPVLYFQGKERGLALNKTNASIITEAYGDETGDWLGYEIELYPAMVQYQKTMVEAIRVKIPRRNAPARQDMQASAITTGQKEPERQPPARELEPAGGGRQMSRNADMDDDIPFYPEMRG